jgi:hypothetical protein
MPMHFIQHNRVSPATGTYCKWWIFIESTLNVARALLVATISIQRHVYYLAYNQILATFVWIGNTGLPILVIILANIALVMKVIGQKYRRQ